MPIGREQVKRLYNQFRRRYFADDDLPDFDTLDFEFESCPDEFGYVEWDAHGCPNLSLDPICQEWTSLLKSTLLHEQIHLKLGPNAGHGKRFYEEGLRIMSLGAVKHFL